MFGIYNKKEEAGFTLIELLVVISIIGLLSTIVLASLQDARVEAQNRAKNSLVGEYLKALELYRSDNNSYPGATNPTDLHCLGDYPDTCYGTRVSDSQLTGAIDNYIPGAPSDLTPVIAGGLDLKGIVYNCPDSDSSCEDFEIRWMLIGLDQNCINGAYEDPSFEAHTLCTFDSEDLLKTN